MTCLMLGSVFDCQLAFAPVWIDPAMLQIGNSGLYFGAGDYRMLSAFWRR